MNIISLPATFICSSLNCSNVWDLSNMCPARCIFRTSWLHSFYSSLAYVCTIDCSNC